MIAQALEHAGPEAAERLRQELETLRRLEASPQRRRGGGTAADLDRDEQGDLLVHPVNLPAVLTWLHVHDQWIRAGMDAEPVALDMRAALEVVREVAAASTARVEVLDTLGRVRMLAGEVLELNRRRKR
jgi:hypothetical protein